MAARLGCLGAGDALPPSYQEALQDVEQVIHACEVADILESGHEDRGQDGKGAGEEHPGETGPAELQEALEHGRTCTLAVPGANPQTRAGRNLGASPPPLCQGTERALAGLPSPTRCQLRLINRGSN